MFQSKPALLAGVALFLFVLLTVSCGDEKSPVAPAIDYRPPLIEWIAPASGADLVGVTRLAFTILDDASGIDRYAVYRNGFAPDEWRMAASDDSVYSIDWDTRDVEDGVHILEVRAWDETGNLGVSPALRVNVRNNQDPREDNTPPDLWWTAPIPGSTLSGETTLQIKFYDESGVDSVRLLKNGAVVTTLFCMDGQDSTRCHTPSCDSSGNDLTGRRGRLPAQLEGRLPAQLEGRLPTQSQGHLPAQSHILANENGDSLTYLWDTSSDPDGVYVFEARGWDAVGNMGSSPSLLVKVRNDDLPPDDRTPPVMSWVSPQPNSEITGIIELQFQVLDNVGVDSVSVYLNGSSPVEFKLDGHENIDYSLNWETTADPDGVYVLELRAWDPSGNMGSGTSLVVQVANDPSRPDDLIAPDVWWTAPDAGSTLEDTVRLQFRVLDEGVIDYIRLYKNGATSDEYEIPGSEAQDYDFLWDTRSDSDGVYVWEARAWDEAGNMGTSPSLLVRVWNNEEPPYDDQTPPVITWLSPDPGDTLLGAVHLRFQVLDNSPLDSVQVYLNGQKWQNLYNMENFYDGDVIWITTDWHDGNYIVQIKAEDAYGNIGLSEVVWFAVWNNRPRVIWVPDDFETIQDAINASQDGDTVRVRAGIYPGRIDFWDKNIWLESEEGPELTIIEADNCWHGIYVNGLQDTTSGIRGFTIRNSEADGIVLRYRASPKILNNIISSSADNNIYALINRAIIRNNVMTDALWDNMALWYSTGQIYNNIIIHSEQHAIWNSCLSQNPIVPDYNLIWDYQWRSNEPPINFGPQNIFDDDPLFEEGSFFLREGSPCIDTGHPDLLDLDGSRSDIGIYGGSYAYPVPN